MHIDPYAVFRIASGGRYVSLQIASTGATFGRL
jgi:hypothetical protein